MLSRILIQQHLWKVPSAVSVLRMSPDNKYSTLVPPSYPAGEEEKHATVSSPIFPYYFILFFALFERSTDF